VSVEQTSKVLALQAAGLLAAGEFKLLLFLADRAAADGSRVFPGDARLLRETRWTPRYLRLVKGRLAARGWLRYVRGAAGGRRVIYRLALPTVPPSTGQLRLPFGPVENPVEILLKGCASAADESSATVISRSGDPDLQIRGTVGESPTTAARPTGSSSAPAADPSNGSVQYVQKKRTEPSLARRPSSGFSSVGEILAQLRRARMLPAACDRRTRAYMRERTNGKSK
jgi:hypothetical protein